MKPLGKIVDGKLVHAATNYRNSDCMVLADLYDENRQYTGTHVMMLTAYEWQARGFSRFKNRGLSFGGIVLGTGCSLVNYAMREINERI